jgi:hypothetical protein
MPGLLDASGVRYRDSILIPASIDVDVMAAQWAAGTRAL